MSYEEAVKAKEWLNQNGYDVIEQDRHSLRVSPDGFFFVAPKESKTREDGALIQDEWQTPRGTELIAFAKSKGFVGTSRRPEEEER